MKSKRQLPRKDWPEEKILQQGAESLSNLELLATFIGSGVKGADAKSIARTMLAKHGPGLLTIGARDLMEFRGIGKTKAAKLNALFELACRLSVGKSGKTLAERVPQVAERGQQYCLAELLATPARYPVTAPAEASNRTHIEFFAGIGLVRYALARHGWSVVYANDMDEGKKRMYLDHFEDDGTFDTRDIHNVPPCDVPCATLATASFPCTDLSLAGGRKGLEGKHSSAFWGFIDIIDKMGARRPPIVLLENVAGFLSSHGGKDFEDALLAMNKLGYDVDAFIVDAVHFVPQSRKRLFVIGIRGMAESSDDFGLALAQTELRSSALASFISSHRHIRWRLRCLPKLPNLGKTLESIIEVAPATSNLWWPEERAAYLLGQMSPKHRKTAERMIAARHVSYGTVFRRVRHGKCMAELRSDGIAGCLRTPKGGSAKQILFEAGRGTYRVRLMTPRECARLMGSDDFTIHVNRDQALFGFGDAVCVPVIEWIAEHYLNQVAESLKPEQIAASA
ncbi:MAG: DNA (cytosine-5-)-methyltransferase [Kiritimatiellaeota bacterium]|nr:DNA (cytosine-5-)-methyltransferase [Kiritimatiellota bacterium]